MNISHQTKQTETVNQSYAATLPKAGQSIGHKILPPRQLKDTITEIYQQKLKFDAKAR